MSQHEGELPLWRGKWTGARFRLSTVILPSFDGAILAGASEIPADYETRLVKFDLSRDGSAGLIEEAFAQMARTVGIDHPETSVYRRAVFYVLTNNRDDHGKNHGFLYRDKKWTLGPAYDLTFVSPTILPVRGLSHAGER